MAGTRTRNDCGCNLPPSVSSITVENWSSVLRSFIKFWKLCRVRCKLYVFYSSLARASLGRVYGKLTRRRKKNGSWAKYSKPWHVKVKPEMKRSVRSLRLSSSAVVVPFNLGVKKRFWYHLLLRSAASKGLQGELLRYLQGYWDEKAWQEIICCVSVEVIP